MSPFLAVRVFSLIVFALATTWAMVWMLANWEQWPQRFPRFLGSMHGMIFYMVYLVVFYHPAWEFRLQFFSDWGSIFLMHMAWYLLFSQLEEDVRLFSWHFPRLIYRLLARA